MRNRRYYGRDRRLPPHISPRQNVKMPFITQRQIWKALSPMMKEIQNKEKQIRVNYIKATLELIRDAEVYGFDTYHVIFKLSEMLMEETGETQETIDYLTKYFPEVM